MNCLPTRCIPYQGDYYANTISSNFFDIIPVLTLFYPRNASNSLVVKLESQLPCMKAFDFNVRSNRTMISTDANKSSAANNVGIRGTCLALALITSLFASFVSFWPSNWLQERPSKVKM